MRDLYDNLRILRHAERTTAVTFHVPMSVHRLLTIIATDCDGGLREYVTRKACAEVAEKIDALANAVESAHANGASSMQKQIEVDHDRRRQAKKK